MSVNRRLFIKNAASYGLGIGAFTGMSTMFLSCQTKSQSDTGTGDDSDDDEDNSQVSAGSLFFKISLAQWSLHKTLFDKKLDNLDFAAKTRNDFGLSAVEYVNQFFADKASDKNYLAEMKKRSDDHGITNVLIMIDGEGGLGDTDAVERLTAVENHYKWVEAAKFLGCHAIRVNTRGRGTMEEVGMAAIDGLGQLASFAADHEINVIVENHGGPSSNGQWLSNVLTQVNLPNCGSLPDFGNFCIERSEDGCKEEYDRYIGTEELMPFAKGVSAKTNVFNQAGDEANIDYAKILKIVKDAGYTGYIGVEYEGNELSEDEGIIKTIELLRKVGATLS